jgi:hypothetical protein
MDPFTLRKSYLDVVDGAGRCGIAYSAELAWGPFSLRWEGLSLHEPGRPPVHRSSWGGRGTIGLQVTCEPWCQPFATRLLATPSGTLDWSCDAPGAHVAIQSDDGVRIEGSGYAEHLVLAMLPWKLPIDELRWGRWIADGSRRSIVWIDWRGACPLTLVVENGSAHEAKDAAVDDATVRCGGTTLRLTGTTKLHSRTLDEILGRRASLLDRLPASWRTLEDRKCLSRAVVGDESGWAIHETVRLP